MASNFQLIKDNEPMSLNKIDEEICLLLGVEVHPKYYGGDPQDEKSFNWFDSIGFQLSQGKTLEEGKNSVKEYLMSQEYYKKYYSEAIEIIIDYLQNNYTVKNWYSWGK